MTTSPSRLFIVPETDALTSAKGGRGYRGGAATYSHYNYLSKGWIARLKRQRFEVALRLARPYFESNVIDMGCADGILLPSPKAPKRKRLPPAADCSTISIAHCPHTETDHDP